MVASRRVNARDVAQAGSLDAFIAQLVDQIKNGKDMEAKEKAAMLIHSLSEQPAGLGGPNQHEDNAKLIARAGVIKWLVELVKAGTPEAQVHACAALAVISDKRKQYQEEIVAENGILPIATALRAGDPGVQEAAAAAIASVSQLRSTQEAIMKCGAVAPLVNLLRSGANSTSDDTQMYASYAVANVAADNLEGQQMIQRLGGLPLLIGLLGAGKTQVAIATAIARLTEGNEHNQAEVTRLGGVPKLIALLTVVHVETQAQAAAALAALASGDNRDEQDVIAAAGGISPLLALVETHSTAAVYALAQRNSINALAMLARNNFEIQEEIASKGGVTMMCALTIMGAASAEVQTQAVLAIAELARHNEKNQTDIQDIGAISSLVALIKTSKASAVEAEVAGAFWALSENNPNNKVSIAAAGAVQPLMVQLASPTARAHDHAAHALASLAFGNADNQAEIAAALVGLLEDPPGGLPTQERAATSLWRLVRENPGAEVVIAKASGAEPLVRLLRNKQASARAYALWSLSLSIDEENQKVVADEGGIKPLVALLTSKDAKIYEQAACALKRLALANSEIQLAISRHGAVEPLITLLDGDGSNRSQEYAAAALSEIALIAYGKVAIDRGGGIQPLVALLADPTGQSESKQHAAAALARLSTEAERERAQQQQRKQRNRETEQQQAQAAKPKISKAEVIAEAGAITPLVNLLSGHRGELAQEEAAGALWALADHASNRTAITEAGGIGPLVILLGCQNAKAREHAELALVRLSIESANRVIIIEKLVDMLQERRGLAAQEQAAAALANLAKESVENRSSIVKADGIPRLLVLLSSQSIKAKENSAYAISKLAHKSRENQDAVAKSGGVQKLVDALLIAFDKVKEQAGVRLCQLLAECIWHMADGNRSNQTELMQAGCIPPIVGMVTNPDPDVQRNAAGSLACLSRDHPENQAAVARSGAIPPLCTMVREGAHETREESAAAIWALATDNAPNKATIAKLGGIEPLVNMLMYGQSEKSSINAAGALAALAQQHADNRLTITKRMVTVLSGKAPPARAVRLLSALASLCDNEPTNQIAIAKSGGVQHLIGWLSTPSEEVQVQAARAMFAVSSNNSQTQSLVGKLGGITQLVELCKKGVLEAQQHAASALWHLASLSENRALIKEANGIPPLVGLLVAEGWIAPQIASMVLVRLAEGSTRAAVAIAEAGGVRPFVNLLTSGNDATQQMAAAALAAIGKISVNRDRIANAGAIGPLIKLIYSTTLGTPETAARALSYLARNDSDEDALSDTGGDDIAHIADTTTLSVGDADSGAEKTAENVKQTKSDREPGEQVVAGGEARRLCVKQAGGVRHLITMLNGSNLKGSASLKPGAVGGWAAAKIGVIGAVETAAIFPGSLVDFGVRIGMQEQAAATLADLAHNDFELQDAIIDADGIPPLLSLVQCGTSLSQEFAAQCVWYLASSIDNQKTLVDSTCITDLVTLVKTGSDKAQEMAAAGLSELAHGFIVSTNYQRKESTGERRRSVVAPPANAASLNVTADPGNGDEKLEILVPEGKAWAITVIQACVRGGHIRRLLREGKLPLHSDEQDDGTSRSDSNLESSMHEGGKDVSSPRKPAVEDALSDQLQERDAEVGEGRETEGKQQDEHKNMADSEEADVKAGDDERPPDLDGAAQGGAEAASEARPPPTPAVQRSQSDDRLEVIAEVGGIPPLIKLADVGTPGGREKAGAALWHLALNADNQVAIASNSGINPLVKMLAEGTPQAQKHASDALTRLAIDNPENQSQIAKKLVGLLDHDDADVVSRAAHDLQALAQEHPGAPVVIVNAGAISPLVTVLSNGKTDEGRVEAAKTLQVLANSGAKNQLAIAVGLVALLGVGTDQAQEYVTALLLELSSGLESDLTNRRAIANAGPFKMLVQQLGSDSIRVKMLAAAVMSKLSGDSEENVSQIAKANGIKPLVALLKADDPETQAHIAVVLADMTRVSEEHAEAVAREGGIPLLIVLLTTGHTTECKGEAAGALGSIAQAQPSKVGRAGAIPPLIELLKSDSNFAQRQASIALANIAAGRDKHQDLIGSAGGVGLLVDLLAFKPKSDDDATATAMPSAPSGRNTLARWDVQAAAALALGQLAYDHPVNQQVIAKSDGIGPLIALVRDSEEEKPKEQAAYAIWRLTSKSSANQVSVAKQGGLEELVMLVGRTTQEGQRMAAEALASLSLNNTSNQAAVARLLTQLLQGSAPTSKVREQAARAISRFGRAHSSNQDALAEAGGVELLVSLLEPRKYDAPAPGSKEAADVENEVEQEEEEDPSMSKHQHIHKELSSAIWSVSFKCPANQKAIASYNGLPLIIALLNDHPSIHRDAAGALWSLAADPTNQKLIAESGGIPDLVEILKTGKKNFAQETAAGALHILATRVENRDLIADAGGIGLLVPLFDGGTDMAKEEVAGALLTLVLDNSANQLTIVNKLVGVLKAGPADATEATNVAAISRVEAQEHACSVMYNLTLDRDNKDAIFRSSTILELVKQLKGGSPKSQRVSGDALVQIAKMSAELRIQVAQQLVTLLNNRGEDVRKRAGTCLREMNEGNGTDDLKNQKEAAMATSVSSTVELLKEGLKNDRIEAQEYALWVLSMTGLRASEMAQVGVIKPLIDSLNSGKLAEDSQEHAAHVITALALEHAFHEELIEKGVVSPLVDMLTVRSVGSRKRAAIGLARLALGNHETQNLIAEAGALKHLIHWLVAFTEDKKPKKPRQRRLPKPNSASDASAAVKVRRNSRDFARRDSGEDKLEARTKRNGVSEADANSEKNASSSPGSPNPDTYQRGSPTQIQPAGETQRSDTGATETGATTNLSPGRTDERESGSSARLTRRASFSKEDMTAGSDEVKPRRRRPSKIGEELQRLMSEEDLELQSEPVPRELAPVAANALADLARDNIELQSRISDAGAMEPLIEMLTDFGAEEAQKAACSALATLAQGSTDNQVTIAKAGGIPHLINLIKSARTGSHESACRALAMLAMEEANKVLIAQAGGIEPLVGMLEFGGDLTKSHAAKALELVALNNAENQMLLANAKAVNPLIALLSSDSEDTAESAVQALLCLTEHAAIARVVIKRLVDVLNAKSTAGHLKAAQALSTLSARSSAHRQVIVKSGGIEPLVTLMGNGQRADLRTPPERAAAVLSDLARIAESKVEIAQAGGIGPLVKMLASGCIESETHAVTALFHLSTTADNKNAITLMGGIKLLVALLNKVTTPLEAQRHAAGTLWQLAGSNDSKNAIVQAGGIRPLIALLKADDPDAAEPQTQPPAAATPRRKGAGNAVVMETTMMLAKETAAAVLSELARSQASFRTGIVNAGGIKPLVELMKGESPGAQRQATCAIWGLTSEAKYRKRITDMEFAIEKIVELLRCSEGETQGYAAATLVNVASDEHGKQEILRVGGPGPMITIALGPDSWLRQQCVQALKLLGFSDPSKKKAGVTGSPPHSPRLLLQAYQEKLAADPNVWCVTNDDKGPEAIVNEEHMSDLAAKLKVGQRIIVDLGERRGEVAYIGKIPEIAAGYWIGVLFDEPVGKNDGTVKGKRYFECTHEHGGFFRPDHIRNDTDPPELRQQLAEQGAARAATPAGVPASEPATDEVRPMKPAPTQRDERDHDPVPASRDAHETALQGTANSNLNSTPAPSGDSTPKVDRRKPSEKSSAEAVRAKRGVMRSVDKQATSSATASIGVVPTETSAPISETPAVKEVGSNARPAEKPTHAGGSGRRARPNSGTGSARGGIGSARGGTAAAPTSSTQGGAVPTDMDEMTTTEVAHAEVDGATPPVSPQPHSASPVKAVSSAVKRVPKLGHKGANTKPPQEPATRVVEDIEKKGRAQTDRPGVKDEAAEPAPSGGPHTQRISSDPVADLEKKVQSLEARMSKDSSKGRRALPAPKGK